MKKPVSVQAITEFGRRRLSKSFFMRDFLFSEIAAAHSELSNMPDDPELAVSAGKQLCETILEPLQAGFGRIAIRSAYRSAEVNDFGNRNGHNCSSNDKNYARHIWDRRDKDGCMGATACIVVPSLYDRFNEDGDWQKLAWWIHDTLPYSHMQFFPKANYWAFNIGWHERPQRIISSYAYPKGDLTKPGMANHAGSHDLLWRGVLDG